MFSLTNTPSTSSLFSTYASISASMMLGRTILNDLIPHQIRAHLFSAIRHYFSPKTSLLTLIIEEENGFSRNEVYDAAETYLCTKISPKTDCLKINKTPRDKNFTIRFEKGEKMVDFFQGVELKWRFVCTEQERPSSGNPNSRAPTSEKRHFELCFDKKHREIVMDFYLPFILCKLKEVKEGARVMKLKTLSNSYPLNGGGVWDTINFEHPATFDTLALDPELKKEIKDDLDRFVQRKEFYRRVGRAWKRGYLLFGPPGTGKSSLIAAIANYLRFDVYDLQLGKLFRDSDLRRLLLATTNKSILVIEDIDCTVELPNRRNYGVQGGEPPKVNAQLTLSGLLNFIDGLWSSCGDERIIIFTTNHKDRIDPALLRPGRMDMHIHMTYCNFHSFKILAKNYLGISSHSLPNLYGEIEDLIENVNITPAEVAEELMRTGHAEVALDGLVKLLKRKRIEEDECTTNARPKRHKNGKMMSNSSNGRIA